jgi:Rrf2 family protein
MTLSKRGDYVVRSALSLARSWPTGQLRKIREVVAEMGVPQTFASQILADLVRAGLATSKAGKDGGYKLSRPPQEIALVEVVEAGEGPLRAERCALGEGPCRWDAVCPLHDTWRAATEALRQVLSTTTLADLVRRDIAIEEGLVGPPDDPHRHGTTSLEVADWVHVEAGMKAVASCLLREDLLTAMVEGAYSSAEALREELVPEETAWAPVQAFATCSSLVAANRRGQPDDGGSPSTDDAGAAFSLTWEAVVPSGAASRAELEVSLRAVDPERTELKVQGRFRAPGPAPSAGPGGDGSVRERLAQVTVRSLLRSLSHEVSAAPSASGKRQAGPEPGPSPRRNGSLARRPRQSARQDAKQAATVPGPSAGR